MEDAMSICIYFVAGKKNSIVKSKICGWLETWQTMINNAIKSEHLWNK